MSRVLQDGSIITESYQYDQRGRDELCAEKGMHALKMKSQRREEAFLDLNKFFMEGVAFLWPA